jgi:hypothetical protein
MTRCARRGSRSSFRIRMRMPSSKLDADSVSVVSCVHTHGGDLPIVGRSSKLGERSKYVFAFGSPHDEFFIASLDWCRSIHDVDSDCVKETGQTIVERGPLARALSMDESNDVFKCLTILATLS